MKTTTAEQAENEAARNWCAGLLAGAGSRIEGEVAKRWVDIGVGALLDNQKDAEMERDEIKRRCKESHEKSVSRPDHPYPSICIVDGEEYGACRTCPLWMGGL